MVFQKKAENTQPEKAAEIDAQIEELKKQKEIIENPELGAIMQFNAIYDYCNNNISMMGERLMRLELFMQQVTELLNKEPEPVKPIEVPPNLPPIEFTKSEKPKGFFK